MSDWFLLSRIPNNRLLSFDGSVTDYLFSVNSSVSSSPPTCSLFLLTLEISQSLSIFFSFLSMNFTLCQCRSTSLMRKRIIGFFFPLLEYVLTILKRLTSLMFTMLQVEETPWVFGVCPDYSKETSGRLKSILPCERELESSFRKCSVVESIFCSFFIRNSQPSGISFSSSTLFQTLDILSIMSLWECVKEYKFIGLLQRVSYGIYINF